MQPRGQRLGGDVGPRQQHPVDRVENLVVGRELGQQALARTARPAGTSSGWMPKARTASAVASPTQAIFTPANARASRPNSSNFSHTARTALTEVNTIHSYRPSTRPLIARSICAGVRGGSTAIVGTSNGIAPYARSRSLIAPACSLVRGTSTFQPYSGRLSHQVSLSRWATAGADGEHDPAGEAERGGDEAVHRGRGGVLRSRRCRRR